MYALVNVDIYKHMAMLIPDLQLQKPTNVKASNLHVFAMPYFVHGFHWQATPEMKISLDLDNTLSHDRCYAVFRLLLNRLVQILGRELSPGGVSPNQSSRWKLAFSPLKHV